MSDPVTSSRIKPWALALGFWTLLGLSYALSAGLSGLSEGEVPNWGRLSTWYLTSFWLWMLLVPLVARLGRQTAGTGWGRFCLVHVPASIAMALVQVLVRVGVFWIIWHAEITTADTFGEYLQREFVFNFYFAQLTYWVILAVLRGMDSRRHLRDERLRSAQLETQLAQSQLHAMRMQLQPHFLFNTLNAISALALAEPNRARKMIARLSDLLRLTLEERHAPLVPLSHELEFVRCYLEIQQERFRDRLETRFDVAENTLKAAVPGMILQPLVENALRHGLLAKTTPGNLLIRIRRDGTHLRLSVEDDGLGLPEGGVVDGVGLGTTRERLRMQFEDRASLDVRAREGGGTRVELRMPFRTVAAARAA
ncbi:MAG TPA: histidine kinase [Rhodanobacteraceae bacterium]|nr:histidine kinase [Rhodanobacteraceae bacterium]